MTSSSTMREDSTDGPAGVLTSIALSEALSPSEFAADCRALVTQHEGDAAHRMLDRLVTDLLSSLGYGEGMAIFIAAVAPYHAGEAA